MPIAETTKPSDPDAVNAYRSALDRPLAGLTQEVRRVIIATSRAIGEEIKWNAPAFFYTGPMEPFPPKEFRRHLVVFSFYRTECLRLVFWHGDRADDASGFLEGSDPDGRRLATLASTSELRDRKTVLQEIVKAQLRHIKD